MIPKLLLKAMNIFVLLLIYSCQQTSATMASSIRAQGTDILAFANETERELPFAQNTQGSAFLKLYWEPGYTWQEETFERRWCMRCRGSCSQYNRIELTPCDYGHVPTQITLKEVLPILINWMQIEVADSGLCLQAIPERDVIFLNGCNRWTVNQWFYGSPESDTDRFEIRPFIEPDQCLTQIHHPKDDEEIIIQYCDVARADNTSYWIKYN